MQSYYYTTSDPGTTATGKQQIVVCTKVSNSNFTALFNYKVTLAILSGIPECMVHYP